MTKHKAYVHLGAHRTGSSSFQMFLGHNRKVLESAGYNLIYPARDGAKGGYDRRIELPSQSIAPEKHRPYYRNFIKPMQQRFGPEQFPDRFNTILSEENILGRMGLFFVGRFYPQAELRFNLVARGLSQPVENTLLVIRNYRDLYRSASAMLAQVKERPPFAETALKLMDMQEGWPDLIERLVRSDNMGQLTVVPYEHRGDDKNLLNLLTGSLPEGLEPASQRPNISASKQALQALQKRYALGENLNARQRNEIIAQFPLDQGNSHFDPFLSAQKATLTKRYNRDLELLAKHPDINFVAS